VVAALGERIIVNSPLVHNQTTTGRSFGLAQTDKQHQDVDCLQTVYGDAIPDKAAAFYCRVSSRSQVTTGA